MAGRRRALKLTFRKSSPITKAVVLAAVVLSTVALVTLQASMEEAQAEYDAMRQQAAALVAQNQQMSERIADLGSVESAIRIAMEELGLVEPDTIVIEPSN